MRSDCVMCLGLDSKEPEHTIQYTNCVMWLGLDSNEPEHTIQYTNCVMCLGLDVRVCENNDCHMYLFIWIRNPNTQFIH